MLRTADFERHKVCATPLQPPAMRGQALAGVACAGGARRSIRAPRARRWPPPGPTPPGHRRPVGVVRPASCGRPPVQSAGRPLPHLVAYGSTNKYRPVNRSEASGSSAKRPTQTVYFFCATATMLTMTPTVKAMDSQRWVCRTHLFQFNGTPLKTSPKRIDSRLLSRLRGPVARFYTDLLGVLCGQCM